MPATADSLAAEIAALEGVVVTENAYGRFFMYDPEGTGGHVFPMATILTDNANDSWSDLDREGVFCVNIGVDRETFLALFGAKASELGERDYTVLDTLLPHPDYGAQYFLRVLNPDATLEKVRELLVIAHRVAAKRTRGGQKD